MYFPATDSTNNVAEIPEILCFRRCFHAVCRADVYDTAKRHVLSFSWKRREIQHCNRESLVTFPWVSANFTLHRTASTGTDQIRWWWGDCVTSWPKEKMQLQHHLLWLVLFSSFLMVKFALLACLILLGPGTSRTMRTTETIVWGQLYEVLVDTILVDWGKLSHFLSILPQWVNFFKVNFWTFVTLFSLICFKIYIFHNNVYLIWIMGHSWEIYKVKKKTV